MQGNHPDKPLFNPLLCNLDSKMKVTESSKDTKSDPVTFREKFIFRNEVVSRAFKDYNIDGKGKSSGNI